jgi:hypothetical protein
MFPTGSIDAIADCGDDHRSARRRHRRPCTPALRAHIERPHVRGGFALSERQRKSADNINDVADNDRTAVMNRLGHRHAEVPDVRRAVVDLHGRHGMGQFRPAPHHVKFAVDNGGLGLTLRHQHRR